MEVVTDLHNYDLNLKATELRLGLPGTSSDQPEKQSERSNKRSSPETDHFPEQHDGETAPPSKVQVIGWPPVRSYMKNVFQQKKVDQKEGSGMLVKVSMDGAPYLRKIDLGMYKGYADLLKAVEGMFKCCISGCLEKEGNLSNRSEDYEPTYQDKDGDWMLVGDVPWDMFVASCTRMRIMKGSDARGFRC